jgi:1-acyl-sn-glycerol-3-phosphate acyltransferase
MLRERFVVLDRDGVINEDSDDYVRSPAEWVPIPGSIEAIAGLTRAGFRIAVVSNQSGLARGFFDLGALNAMHRKLRDLTSLRGGRLEMILFCPHGPGERCNCRKPQVGLLREIETRATLDLIGLPFIGDSLGDIRAARQAGMVPILVKTGKGERTITTGGADLNGVSVFDDRSFFYQGFLVFSVTLFGGLIALLGRWLPFRIVGRMARAWARSNLIALKYICGLDYCVQGLEHLGTDPCVILAKHQSAWETIALRAILPIEQTWVLKQELLRIPIFGLALRRFRCIAIDRAAGRAALKQLLTDGQRLLRAGLWVIVFPEGTRVPPGERGCYSIGGALLAHRAGCPITPIAHNAGVFWARRGLVKRPGTIQLVIGPSIAGKERTAHELGEEAEAWIEETVAHLPATP